MPSRTKDYSTSMNMFKWAYLRHRWKKHNSIIQLNNHPDQTDKKCTPIHPFSLLIFAGTGLPGEKHCKTVILQSQCLFPMFLLYLPMHRLRVVKHLRETETLINSLQHPFHGSTLWHKLPKITKNIYMP